LGVFANLLAETGFAIEDMAMRGLRSDTRHDYIRLVRSIAAFLGRLPDTATAEDIGRFQVHQRESEVQPPTINCSVSALRFFFTVTLDRQRVPRGRKALPDPLAIRLLQDAPIVA
jgi:integrase/recombinase XerD